MLISQRIQSDPNFLQSIPKKPSLSVFELKVKILNSIKFLVPENIAPIDRVGYIHGSEIIGKELTKKNVEEKRSLYHEYGKLPFNSIFIENEGGGILIERAIHKNITSYKKVDGEAIPTMESFDTMIVHVDKKGIIHPLRYLINTDNSFIDGTESSKDIFPTPICYYATKAEIDIATLVSDTIMRDNHQVIDPDFDLMNTIGTGIISIVYEVLLFIHAVNADVVKYTPQKFELKSVPKVLHPKYEYRILDINRTKKEYESLDSVLKFIRDGDGDKLDRRAHLVRGHFKRKNGKLFWWNAFLRNKKNIDDVGIVDKDYQLVNK
jgi:hypothetical protein